MQQSNERVSRLLWHRYSLFSMQQKEVNNVFKFRCSLIMGWNNPAEVNQEISFQINAYFQNNWMLMPGNSWNWKSNFKWFEIYSPTYYQVLRVVHSPQFVSGKVGGCRANGFQFNSNQAQGINKLFETAYSMLAHSLLPRPWINSRPRTTAWIF